MINKVSKKECLEAIDYFFVKGYLENSGCYDVQYYTKILLKKVANDYKLELVGIDEFLEGEKWIYPIKKKMF